MTQSSQQETLVHIIYILNVTQFAAQVNRHSINILMGKVDKTSHDISNLYNLTTSLATSISFHQFMLHIRSVFASLYDSLDYIRRVSIHTMDYIDAATSGTLSPHILPVMDLQKMLLNLEETLPSTIVANLYIEDLETKAIKSSPSPPSFWRRFVDDTLTIMKSSQVESFLNHLNSIDHHI